jgi:hypothetical protein
MAHWPTALDHFSVSRTPRSPFHTRPNPRRNGREDAAAANFAATKGPSEVLGMRREV